MDTDLWVLLLVGLAAGIADATTGGGSMLQIPALFALAGPGAVAPVMAVNKASAAVGNVVSYVRFARLPDVARPDRRTVAVSLVTAVPMVCLGAWLAGQMDTSQFRPYLVGALLVVLVYVVAVQPRLTPTRSRAATPLALAVLTAALGFYDGFLGPATGSVLILVMQWYLGAQLRTGLASAKLVQLILNGTGALVFGLLAPPPLLPVLALAVGNAFGGWLGSGVVSRVDDRLLRLFLVVGVLGSVAWTLVR